jgi:carboxymethylenebutenolidase
MRDYSIAPSGANARTPSILLIVHLGGVDASMRDAADQFADAGFAVYAPDLYAKFDAPAPDTEPDAQAYMPYAKQLTTESINEDIRRAVDALRSRFSETRIGIVGFCMGGRIAMVRSTGYSSTFGAAAIWYGFSDDIRPESVDIPIVGSYGEADVHLPPQTMTAFFSRVPTDHDVKIYPHAGHGFFHKEAAYDPEAARDSFTRTTGFLRRHLEYPRR